MIKRELFKRRVIELIHGVPYDEAIKKEKYKTCKECNGTGYENGNGVLPCQNCCANGKTRYTYTITIGRVMKALSIVLGGLTCDIYEECSYSIGVFTVVAELINIWKLTNEDGSECTDDDQSDEIIEELYNLIK